MNKVLAFSLAFRYAFDEVRIAFRKNFCKRRIGKVPGERGEMPRTRARSNKKLLLGCKCDF